jgi:hypothetical protein
MNVEILDEPLVIELLVNLPYDEAYDQCMQSLTTIHGDIDSSSKERGSLVAIPVGVPVFTRYLDNLHFSNFIEDRISFKLITESKTKTRIKIQHNLKKGSAFKIQKEQEKMQKIREYLQQWEVKIPDNNDRS